MSHQHKNTAINDPTMQRPAVVFQLWSDDAGVFFEKETYARYRLIQLALEKASTWRDLVELLPNQEFETVNLWWSNEGEHVYQDGDEFRFICPADLDDFWAQCGESRVIRPEEEYDPAAIGVLEGDYPNWLGNTADEVLPKAFVERFGTGVGSPAAGCWIEYRLSDLMEMVEVLGFHGYSVTAHLSYDFNWWRQIDLAS